MQKLYRNFKEHCPTGILTEDAFREIYSQIFPKGGQYLGRYTARYSLRAVSIFSYIYLGLSLHLRKKNRWKNVRKKFCRKNIYTKGGQYLGRYTPRYSRRVVSIYFIFIYWNTRTIQTYKYIKHTQRSIRSRAKR